MTTLQTINASASPEVQMSENFDAVSPAGLYGRNAVTTTGTTWGYYGGPIYNGGTVTMVANGTVALTPSNVNYIEATLAGVVSANIVGFTAGSIPTYEATVGASSITSYVDKRSFQLAGSSPDSATRWVKVGDALAYGAFSAAALFKTNTLFSLVAGGVIHAVKVKHSTAFAGTAITVVTAEVGTAAALDKYAAAYDVLQAAAAGTFALSQALGSESQSGATNILITLRTVGANTSALTAGVLDVWALISRTP